jgi:serine/threonine-protein kinase
VDQNDDLLEGVADAILDGTAIDWARVVADADGRERPLLDRLRVLGALADVHRDHVHPSPVNPGEGLGRWGHLMLLERIGCGAFGQVYRARDTLLDRDVALKLLPAGRPAGDPRARSIIEEGRLLARVRHPNVVTIHGAERIGDEVGISMELVTGQTLEQLLVQGRRFTPAEAVAIGIQLCHAVSAVHEAGLLHRDIKAHNVMLAEGGRLVLMDFGTGWDLSDASSAALAGTPLYLAPELLGGAEPSVRSDIYSVGVLMHRVLTGSYPVEAGNLRQLVAAHQQRNGAGPGTASRRLPRGLFRIVDRATRPSPDERYGTASSVARDLVRLNTRWPWSSYGYALVAAAILISIVPIGWWAVGRQDGLAAPRVAQGSRVESTAGGGSASLPRSATISSPSPSIAVLPFRPLSGQAGDEGMQFGITEAVINHLARTTTLRVEPLARVQRFARTTDDPLEAGRELGVDVVLHAEVQRVGDNVRVHSRLLRTNDGATLATRDWNEPYRHILDVQSQLAESLAAVLTPTLTPADRNRIRRQETSSPEAFQHYLFGRYHMEVRRPDRLLQAEREFREAVSRDPRYARAHAGLSLALVHAAWLGARKGIDVMGAAKDAAMQAVAIDDSVALAHTALGYIHECFEYDHARSQAEHLRAVALDGNDLWVLRAYASFLMRRDAVDEALTVIQRALDLDPASPLSNRHRAMMLYTARRYDECVAVTQRTLTLDPQDASMSYSWLGRCLEAQGKLGEAVDAYENGRAAGGRPELAQRMKRRYAVEGWKSYWRESLRLLPPDTIAAAAAHARLGNNDEAVRTLLRLEQRRAPALGFLNMPEWDSLKSEPGFQALRVRSGSSDETRAQPAATRAGGRR